MKQLWTVLVAGLAITLAACGSSNNSINGNWTASLVGGNGSTIINFGVSLTQSSNNSLSITNLSFTSGSACFAGGASATGGFSASGNFNGNVSGGLQMTITSNSSSGNNQLTLQGTLHNNTITGNWNLTGTTAGCTGSGTFTMNKS